MNRKIFRAITASGRCYLIVGHDVGFATEALSNADIVGIQSVAVAAEEIDASVFLEAGRTEIPHTGGGFPPDERIVEMILSVIGDHYGFPYAHLLDKRRQRRAAIALGRRIAIYLVRENLSWSYPKIARAFQIHHTTAISAYDKMKHQLASNAEVADDVAAINAALQERGFGGLG